jgi:5-methylcytosine-specific restriction endonuclease McrA
MDPTISINQENLELLCKDCHNKEHKRFTKEKEFDSDGNLIPR